MRFTTTVIVSEETLSRWGQAYHQGDGFVVVEVEKKEEEYAFEEEESRSSALTIGRTILTTLSGVLEQEHIVHLSSLDDALRPIFARLPQSTTNSIIVGKAVHAVLLVSIHGNGAAYLCRGGKLGRICSGGSVSGHLQPADRLFLFSQSAEKAIDRHIIASSGTVPLQEVAEELTQLLHKNEVVGAAGLLVDVSDDKSVPPVLSLPKKRLIPAFHFPSLLLRLRSLSGRLSRAGLPIKALLAGKRKRTVFSIFALFFILLLVSITFGVNKKRADDRIRELTVVKERVLHDVTEAEALIDINSMRSRTLLSQAKDRLAPLSVRFPKTSAEAKEVRTLLERIDTLLGKAAKVYKTADAPVFFDLTLIKPHATGKRMGLYQGMLVILDQTNNAVYTVDIGKKRTEIVSGGEKLKSPTLVTMHGTKAFILTSEGIVMTSLISKNSAVVVQTDTNWGEIADMKAFAGNVYLLSATSNTIVKYPATESGLGEKIVYLPDDASHQFSQNSRMAIDGAIWTITGDRIVKFLQGRPDGTFSLSDFEGGLSPNTHLFTDDTTKFLYVLDQGNNRIVVFDKEGHYQAQYVWEGIGKSTAFIVSEAQKVFILLSESMLFTLEMKHL